MSNVIKKLTFGSTDYMVGNNIIQLNVIFDANQDWSTGNNITCSLVSAVDFANPDTPVLISDYSVLFTEMKGGRPVYISVSGPTSGDEWHYGVSETVIPMIPGPGAPCMFSMINKVMYYTGALHTTYRAFNCYFRFNSNGTYAIEMKSLGESVDVLASASLKPVIIKTAAISGDPAVNDVITLTASEIYDTAKGTTVAANRLFAKGTYGRRLVIYIQGAGLTLVPCELYPVYNTDYDTPVLFSGFTGIKFRGGTRTNYYGLYVKLESDGTLKAIVEDRQVYTS